MDRFEPRIEMFSPFEEPFQEDSDVQVGEERPVVQDKLVEFMKSDSANVVAKCTPCQCSACR